MVNVIFKKKNAQNGHIFTETFCLQWYRAATSFLHQKVAGGGVYDFFNEGKSDFLVILVITTQCVFKYLQFLGK